jgi:hypothetical protein
MQPSKSSLLDRLCEAGSWIIGVPVLIFFAVAIAFGSYQMLTEFLRTFKPLLQTALIILLMPVAVLWIGIMPAVVCNRLFVGKWMPNDTESLFHQIRWYQVIVFFVLTMVAGLLFESATEYLF